MEGNWLRRSWSAQRERGSAAASGPGGRAGKVQPGPGPCPRLPAHCQAAAVIQTLVSPQLLTGGSGKGDSWRAPGSFAGAN